MTIRLTPTFSTLGLCAALAAGASTAALAQDAVTPLAPQVYNGVTVVKGGVSVDEADAVKRMAAAYPLRVVISAQGGSYHIPDQLTVWRHGERLAEIPEAGPWVLMDLPAGRYTLQGHFGGQVLQRDVIVSRSPQTVHWVVPASLS